MVEANVKQVNPPSTVNGKVTTETSGATEVKPDGECGSDKDIILIPNKESDNEMRVLVTKIDSSNLKTSSVDSPARRRSKSRPSLFIDTYPAELYRIISCLLEPIPHQRISAEETLKLPYFDECRS